MVLERTLRSQDRAPTRDRDPGAGHVPSLVRGEQKVRAGKLAVVPGRPSWMSSPKCSTFSGGIVTGMSGVQIEPGRRCLPDPCGPGSWARLAQGSAMAALVAAYGANSGEGMSELTDVCR